MAGDARGARGRRQKHAGFARVNEKIGQHIDAEGLERLFSAGDALVALSSFEGLELDGVSAGGATFEQVVFRSCSFDRVDFSRSSLTDAVFVGCRFLQCKMERCWLNRCDFRSCSAPGISFQKSRLTSVSFTDSQLRYADFSESVMIISFQALWQLSPSRGPGIRPCGCRSGYGRPR